MSIDSAKAFIEQLKKDEAFRGEYEESENKEQFIRDAGYDFTETEMVDVQDELTDDDLLEVAGGFSCSSQSCSSAQNCSDYTTCSSDCTHDKGGGGGGGGGAISGLAAS